MPSLGVRGAMRTPCYPSMCEIDWDHLMSWASAWGVHLTLWSGLYVVDARTLMVEGKGKATVSAGRKLGSSLLR